MSPASKPTTQWRGGMLSTIHQLVGEEEREVELMLYVQEKVYVKRGITYVPRYDDISLFVGPGRNTTYTEQRLIDAGAVRSQLALWERKKAKGRRGTKPKGTEQ